jgi:hypothetical protein
MDRHRGRGHLRQSHPHRRQRSPYLRGRVDWCTGQKWVDELADDLAEHPDDLVLPSVVNPFGMRRACSGCCSLERGSRCRSR